MSELKRADYLAMIRRRRDAAIAIADGIREYLTAEFDAEIELMEAEPPEDTGAIVASLTESLMAATSRVQIVEAQAESVKGLFTHMDPQVAQVLAPFAPIINDILVPMLQNMFTKMYRNAVRERDEIQADLMQYEPKEQNS